MDRERIKEFLEKNLENLERQKMNLKGYEQMMTGPVLKEIYEFQKGYIYCIAGRPGMGKTTLARKIIIDEKDKEFTVFSLEMKKEQFMKGLENCRNITLYDNINTIEEIEKLVKNKKTDIILIDYFQLVRDDGNSLDEEYTMISHRLKTLATETGTAIIIISQLNRMCEERIDKRPRLTDFRHCPYSNLLQVSDAIMFIYDEHYYNQNKAHSEEIIIAKNRNGDCKTVFLNPEDNKIFWN